MTDYEEWPNRGQDIPRAWVLGVWGKLEGSRIQKGLGTLWLDSSLGWTKLHYFNGPGLNKLMRKMPYFPQSRSSLTPADKTGPFSLPAWHQRPPKGMLTRARNWGWSLNLEQEKSLIARIWFFKISACEDPKEGFALEDSFICLTLSQTCNQHLIKKLGQFLKMQNQSLILLLLGISLGYFQCWEGKIINYCLKFCPD